MVLASAYTRILVNGELSATIYQHKGLRQGAPLSPLLFVLVIDMLDALIRTAVSNQLFSPLATNLPSIRASFYTDDVVMFIKPSRHEITVTKAIFDTFAVASGLTTNF